MLFFFFNYFLDNFKLRTIPNIIVVIDNLLKGKIINFEDVVNIEEHSYKMLEWKLAKTNALNYEEDLTHPPEISKSIKKPAKTIRGPAYDSSDSDLSE